MKKLMIILGLLFLSIAPAFAQAHIPASGSGGGGGSSPFPSQFAPITPLSSTSDLITSADGTYIYVSGTLVSNGDGAIVKMNAATGAVVATVDLGASTFAYCLALSADGSKLYSAQPNPGNTWWVINTSDMTIAHTSTLAASVGSLSSQEFDLSPNGAIYAYVDGATQTVHEINTSTYAVTDVAVGHSSGGAATAICWDNGSNTDFYVAYSGSGTLDKYSSGSYASSIVTGDGGSPDIFVLRSGRNGYIFAADLQEIGTSYPFIVINAGTPQVISTNQPVGFLIMNTNTPVAAFYDECLVCAGSSFYLYTSAYNQLYPLSVPEGIALGGGAAAFAPDISGRIFELGGVVPELMSFTEVLSTQAAPGIAGNIMTSDGQGDWVSAPLGGNGAPSALNGSTSGYIYYTMPATGATFKKVIIYLASLVDAGQTLTFPVSFYQAPVVVGNSTGISTSSFTVTTTGITFPSTSGVNGYLILDGF